jgi:hypothetical protein
MGTAAIRVAGEMASTAALIILTRLVLAVRRQPRTRLAGSAGFARTYGDHRLEPATGRAVFLRSLREAATAVATVVS